MGEPEVSFSGKSLKTKTISFWSEKQNKNKKQPPREAISNFGSIKKAVAYYLD